MMQDLRMESIEDEEDVQRVMNDSQDLGLHNYIDGAIY